MKKIITILLVVIMGAIAPVLANAENTKNADLKSLMINDSDFGINPSQMLYFIYNYSSAEISLSVEPENPNSAVFFGEINDNSGEFYQNDLQEWKYTFSINESAKATRIMVKVISESGENEKVYSIVIKYSIRLTLSAWFHISYSGFDSAFTEIDTDNLYLDASRITDPSEDISDAVKEFIGENEHVEYITILPCDKNTGLEIEYDKDKALDVHFEINIPNKSGLNGWGKNYKICRIYDNKAEQIPILWETTMQVAFDSGQYGTFAIIYNPKIFTVSFYDYWGHDIELDDWNLFYSVSDLEMDDIVPIPTATPSKSGYTFSGWRLLSRIGVEGQALTAESVVSNGIVYIADWTEKSSSSSTVKNTVINSPSANENSGAVEKGSAIILTSNYPNGKIYYTLDGTSPTINSDLYSEPIIIDKSVTLKFMVVENGASSTVVSKTYTVTEPVAGIKENSNTIRFIKGYPDNTFKPDQAITRYEMLESLKNLVNISKIGINKDLSDVPLDKAELVSLFTGAEIIDGYDDGIFKGEEGLTRAEFSKIMSIILNLEIKDTEENKFKDISAHWAKNYINSFAELNYLMGYDNNVVKPDNKLTRAEFTAIINRIIKINTEPVDNIYTDIMPNHWAISDILLSCLPL